MVVFSGIGNLIDEEYDNLRVVIDGWELTRNIKGDLSGLRQFLAIESPLKIMKNVFYFTLKALFVLKIFKFLFWLFGHGH